MLTKSMLFVLLPLQLLTLLALTPTATTVSVTWLQAENELQKISRTTLQQSNIISDFVSLVSREFKLGHELELVIGGEGVPSYSASTQTLVIPFTYLADVTRAQSQLTSGAEDDMQADRVQALGRGMDMLEYTLYHLFGHVLADNASPDADDEAEAISTWVMLTLWPNGGEQWFAAVSAFGQASQQLDGPLSDYWHGHSLYKSRQSRLECAIAGSDPTRYEPLLRPVLDPQQRIEACVNDWQALEQTVRGMLAPLLINK